MDTPRIYVACLAAYNNAKLHGAWIDADQEAKAIREEIRAMLAESPEPHAEEWAIHDDEGFGSIDIGEYESIETVSAIAQLIAEHGEAAIAAITSAGSHYLDDARELLDRYQGEFDSAEDWAFDAFFETHEVPEHLAPYIDTERWLNDLECNGECLTVPSKSSPGKVHVFC